MPFNIIKEETIEEHGMCQQEPSQKTGDTWIDEMGRISQEEYETLIAEANPAKRPIHKRRQGFEWDGRYLELDTFVEPSRPHHLLEIEHVSMEDEISFPPFLNVIKEVTDDPEWYNMNIAKSKN